MKIRDSASSVGHRPQKLIHTGLNPLPRFLAGGDAHLEARLGGSVLNSVTHDGYPWPAPIQTDADDHSSALGLAHPVFFETHLRPLVLSALFRENTIAGHRRLRHQKSSINAARGDS